MRMGMQIICKLSNNIPTSKPSSRSFRNAPCNTWSNRGTWDSTIKVFQNLFTDLSRRNVDLSPSLRMSARNNILSLETIREILNQRFFTNFSGFLIRDGGLRYYIADPTRPSHLVSAVSKRLNLANRNMLRERWRTSEEVAAILLTIAQRVIPAFFTMTPRQISNHINEDDLFEFNVDTNMYKLWSDERIILHYNYRFSDFEGQRLLALINEQEEMRDGVQISSDLNDYWQIRINVLRTRR